MADYYIINGGTFDGLVIATKRTAHSEHVIKSKPGDLVPKGNPQMVIERPDKLVQAVNTVFEEVKSRHPEVNAVLIRTLDKMQEYGNLVQVYQMPE